MDQMYGSGDGKVQLEEVPCDFCGSTQLRTLFCQRDNYINSFARYEYEFPIVTCRSCGLVFVNPRPTRDTISFFYPNTYHDERLPETMRHRYQRQKQFLPILQPGSKILDIGCAKGDFFSWLMTCPDIGPLHLYGCDAYSNGIRRECPVHFTGAELPECRYPDAFFDCVTAWAVLEHVHSPRAYFSEVARILKPQHRFIFLVPNFNSLTCRVAKRDDIARHIYQFTPKSIGNYLKMSGFHSWDIHFDDSIFDGRGTGSLVTRLGANKIVCQLDSFIFAFHWEKRLKISGIMIVDAVR